MQANPLSLQEVKITDHVAESRLAEESLSMEIINEEYLRKNRSGSLMQSLERLPGVSSMDIGSGLSKPVIRGMGFQRIVVVENNIKHEGQQWGQDHGLEIDQYSIDKVEIIKGPASLLYGSDAIAGVINIQHDRIPERNSFEGELDVMARSNNNLLGTALSLAGRKDEFFLGLDASIIDYGDYRVPADSIEIYSYKAALDNNYLRNTAGRERNVSLDLGIDKRRFKSRFFMSNVYTKSGFFANTHGLEPRNVNTELHDGSNRDILDPFQEVNHFKLTNSSRWLKGNITFESHVGFQRNLRKEWSRYVNHGYMPDSFPDTLGFSPRLERQFDKYIISFTGKSTYYVNESTNLSAGVDGEHQGNRINGRGFIIPEFIQNKYGAYFLAKHKLSSSGVLRGGIRYDFGVLHSDEYTDWFPSTVEDEDTFRYLQRAPELDRRFSSISGSLGYVQNFRNVLLKFNLGKSFRMPVAKELVSNGVNYHRYSYEIGNPDLSPEVSWQVDASMEYKVRNFAIGTTPFLSYFPNYIYLNPGYLHDRLYGVGNQKFNYVQSEVIRFGGEVHAHYRLMRNVQLGMIGEYLYSEQLSGDKKGFTLPLSPPPSALLNIRYQREDLGFLEEFSVNVDYKVTAQQSRIVPPEEPTPGYQLVNLGMSAQLGLRAQTVNISVQLNNVFNIKYFDHTSYYRLINVPEPGRNLILNINLPITGNLN
jgi:iron complex outermembrane receptor protein